MRMMVATWWMICSLKSCVRHRGGGGGGGHPDPNLPHSCCSPSSQPLLCPKSDPEPQGGVGGVRGSHLALDIRSDAEEQRPIEGEFDHVVPVLGGQDALQAKDVLGAQGFHRRPPPTAGIDQLTEGPPWAWRGPPRSVGICSPTGWERGGGAHLDGVPLPHLPEVVEPRLLWDGGRETERGINGGRGDTRHGGGGHYSHPL